MVCCEFGHKDFIESKEEESRIKSEIANLVEHGIDTFYLGGYGHFDGFMAKCVLDMKKVYPQIKSYLVLCYLNQRTDDYDKIYIKKYFDGTIYPPLERAPKRYAILKRNEWLVNEADYIIFHIDHSWGGASKAYELALKKKKRFINFGKAKE